MGRQRNWGRFEVGFWESDWAGGPEVGFLHNVHNGMGRFLA
jgi:hypothetical protein